MEKLVERDAYLKIYPMGTIPLLVLDDGQWVPESSIIVEYLETHFSDGPKLIPDDPEVSRQVRCMDRMHDFYLSDPVATLVMQSLKPEPKRNQKLIERSRFRIGVMYDIMEKNLAKQTWITGEAFTMSDCAAMPPLVYSEEVAPLDEHPNIIAYWQRLQERPSIRRVLDEAAPYLTKLRERLSAQRE